MMSDPAVGRAEPASRRTSESELLVGWWEFVESFPPFPSAGVAGVAGVSPVLPSPGSELPELGACFAEDGRPFGSGGVGIPIAPGRRAKPAGFHTEAAGEGAAARRFPPQNWRREQGHHD